MNPQQRIEELDRHDERRRYHQEQYCKHFEKLFDELNEGDRVGDLVLKSKGEMGLLFEREGETIVYYRQ